MKKYNVAILGCGAIFSRHLAAIQNNPEFFNLVGLYDPISELTTKYCEQLGVKAYAKEDEVYTDSSVNCVVILTPSFLHFDQAKQAIINKKHVIVEKPVSFLASEIDELKSLAKQNLVEVFVVLQVRLNPAVIMAKRALAQGLFGSIRSVSLVQRWQRPITYFSGWRGSFRTGGGVLREFGIHYLDVLQFLVGLPKVSYANFYNPKFTQTDVHDTVLGLLDFGKYGGSFEISIAAEPKNLECSLSIMTDEGYLKLGGKSLDEVESISFIKDENQRLFNQIVEEVNQQQTANLVNQGASPYHPELYRQIIINPHNFILEETRNVIKLIEDVYGFMK